MTKHRPTKRAACIKAGEVPTKERCRQNGGVVSEIVSCDLDGKTRIKRYRAAWECPLDAYKDREIITEPQHRAGLRFRQAYHRLVLSRHACAERLPLRPTSIATGLTMDEKTIKDAYRTIPPHNIGTVIDVCGHGMHIWNPAAYEKLRKGLGSLALHWNMMAIETCEPKRK